MTATPRSTESTITEEDMTLSCSDGIQLRGKRWRRRPSSCSSSPLSVKPIRVLCLHGFLDNCETHWVLGPYLAENLSNNNTTDIVAFDFPGHGQSSHKSKDADGQVSDYCYYVAEAVKILGWVIEDDTDTNTPAPAKFILIGHSMGGAVSTMYAASFPQQVASLITLDAFGPDFESPQQISTRKRRHILDRYEHNVKRNSNGGKVPIKQYSNLQAAANARMRTARLAPGGHQYLSEEAAMKMVQRATTPTMDNSNNNAKVRFIHDPRLKYSPVLLHSPAQVEGFWKAIQCPMLCVMAEDGWPFPAALMERALGWVKHKGNLTVETLPGSHHFHADPDTAMAVAETVVDFIQR